MCAGSGWRGLPTSLVVLSTGGGMFSTLVLLPTPCFCFWLFRNGSCGFFWSLCILCPEFELTAHAHSYFWSHTVSLYFVAGGEVCSGTNNAAPQQRVSGPRLSHSPPRDPSPLFLRDKGPKVSFATPSCWTGAVEPSLP